MGGKSRWWHCLDWSWRASYLLHRVQTVSNNVSLFLLSWPNLRTLIFGHCSNISQNINIKLRLTLSKISNSNPKLLLFCLSNTTWSIFSNILHNKISNEDIGLMLILADIQAWSIGTVLEVKISEQPEKNIHSSFEHLGRSSKRLHLQSWTPHPFIAGRHSLFSSCSPGYLMLMGWRKWESLA